MLEEEGIGCIVFSPLAQGLLTDRYLDGIPAGSRASKPYSYLRPEAITEAKLAKVRALNEIAQARGQTLAQMALAWNLRHRAVTSVLVGASRVGQIEESVGGAGSPDIHAGRAGSDRGDSGAVTLRLLRGHWPSGTETSQETIMKVAVIGGGSTYTPELVRGFLERTASFPLTELSLMDVAAERLAIVGGFAERMVPAQGQPFRVVLTGDLSEAIEGAAYVITQLRVGGMEARREDEYLGRRHGLIGQETTGVGGMAKALRTIPVILEIARAIRRSCAGGAAGQLHQPLRTGHRGAQPVCARCPVGGRVQRRHHDQDGAAALRWADLTADGVDPAEAELDTLGLNHLSWHRGLRVAWGGALAARHGGCPAPAAGRPRAGVGCAHDREPGDDPQLLPAVLLLHESQACRAGELASLARRRGDGRGRRATAAVRRAGAGPSLRLI